MNKRYFLIGFIIVAIIQLFVPAQMIWERENVLSTGKVFKFKTAPIDPSDPFRGKYITLSFASNTVPIDQGELWEKGEKVYVLLTPNSEGFTKLADALKSPPLNGEPYLETKVKYGSHSQGKKITVDLPFNRFYMEESLAYDAELAFMDATRDTNNTTFALVSIRDGKAVLKNVFINNTPIAEIAKSRQE